MTDYIRKALELVGWLKSDDEGEYLRIPGQSLSAYFDETFAACDQYLLDALAAQLVRQVDELEDYDINLDFDGRTVCIVQYVPEGIGGKKLISFDAPDGPDRTMNTIRAIVDSGVLDNE
jgi:hypothetical protein